MSKIPISARDHKQFKYNEYVENNTDVEKNDATAHIFFAAFNIGYKFSRQYIRNKITSTHTYDECLHCGCLALIDRQTLMCIDCGKIQLKGVIDGG